MMTEQELRDVLVAAVDDPAAEAYTRGLSDRVLAQAGDRKARRWVRFAPAVAVGTAFVVAGVFGVSALGGDAGGGGKRVTVSSVPKMLANPAAGSALLDFEVECLGKGTPKLAMDWVWDPDSQQYRGVDASVYTSFTPSPDGKRVLVVQGIDTARWGVAGWADAVAMRVPFHDKNDGIGLRWTDDGSELTSTLQWVTGPGKSITVVLGNKTADFYDPNTGAQRLVPIPRAVLDGLATGQWQLMQWQGNHDTVRFPMMSTTGDRIQWMDASGKVTRTATLQNGLPANSAVGAQFFGAYLSPDGRYLAVTDGTWLATYDLTDKGRRLAHIPADGFEFRNGASIWTGDHEIILAGDPALQEVGHPGGPNTATGGSAVSRVVGTDHSPVYRVLGPDLKVIEETRFVLPDDPEGRCSSWPISWAPKTQFSGAFVP